MEDGRQLRNLHRRRRKALHRSRLPEETPIQEMIDPFCTVEVVGNLIHHRRPHKQLRRVHRLPPSRNPSLRIPTALC